MDNRRASWLHIDRRAKQGEILDKVVLYHIEVDDDDCSRRSATKLRTGGPWRSRRRATLSLVVDVSADAKSVDLYRSRSELVEFVARGAFILCSWDSIFLEGICNSKILYKNKINKRPLNSSIPSRV